MRLLLTGLAILLASLPAFAEDDLAARIATALQGTANVAEAAEALEAAGLLNNDRSADTVIYALKTVTSLQNMSVNPNALARALESGTVDIGGDGGSGGDSGSE